MMVAASTVRVVGWTAGFTLSAGAFGLGWANQDIAVPLWALLVLTFVPTADLISAVRVALDNFTSKLAPSNTSDE
jgi:hypothetical protein